MCFNSRTKIAKVALLFCKNGDFKVKIMSRKKPTFSREKIGLFLAQKASGSGLIGHSLMTTVHKIHFWAQWKKFSMARRLHIF